MKIVEKILTSTINQGMLSAFNFILTIYLIKSFSIYEFGKYSLVYACGLTLVSFQNSLIVTPMSYLTRSRIKEGLSKYQCYYNNFHWMFLVIAIAISFPLSIALSLPSLFIALYFIAVSSREYFKSILLLSYKTRNVLVSDIFFIFLSTVFIFILNWMNEYSLENVFLILSTSMLASTIYCFIFIEKINQRNVKLIFKFYVHKMKPISTWTTLGVLLTELHSRAYLIVTSLILNVEVVGVLQAARSIFGPLNLVINGWVKISRNYLTQLNQARCYSKQFEFAIYSTLLMVVINVVFGLTVFIFWDLIYEYVFSGKINEEWLDLIVFIWWILIITTHVRMIMSILIQSYGEFRYQALLNGFACFITNLSLFYIVHFQHWSITALSLVLGEIIMLMLSIHYYVNLRKKVND